MLRFRATCFRVGKHSFGSMEVAREFGGELQDKFNWVVDLVNFNAEVILFLLKGIWNFSYISVFFILGISCNVCFGLKTCRHSSSEHCPN